MLPYDQTTNRISDTMYSYDANGNLTGMPSHTMSYDIENRMVQTGYDSNRYNPWNQRVSKVLPGGAGVEYYFYGVDGRRLATYTNNYTYTAFTSADVYFGGKKLQSQGQLVYQDRLGSNVNVAPYYPYGKCMHGNCFYAVAGTGGTNLPSGSMLIAVNTDGAFFNSESSTGYGVNIPAGSDAAKAFILLHELRHLTGAGGFREDDNNEADQKHSNALVLENCGRTVSRAAGVP